MAFASAIPSRPLAAVAQLAVRSQSRCLGFPACHELRANSSLAASTSRAGCRAAQSSLFGSRLGLRLAVAFVPRLKPFRMAGSASATAVTEKSLHDFTVKDISGNDVDLSSYKGKVLLVVNVASKCGLTTSNYTELSEIYSKYKGQDFEILAFPCNQFGGQEPGTNEQIKEFACTRFKAEFPIFDKVEVNGANTSPVYKFLKSTKSGGLLGGLLGDKIKWNFEKFLVDKNGQVVQRYDPTTSPLKIEKDIKELLDG